MADKDTLMKEFVDTEAAKTEDAVKDPSASRRR